MSSRVRSRSSPPPPQTASALWEACSPPFPACRTAGSVPAEIGLWTDEAGRLISGGRNKGCSVPILDRNLFKDQESESGRGETMNAQARPPPIPKPFQRTEGMWSRGSGDSLSLSRRQQALLLCPEQTSRTRDAHTARETTAVHAALVPSRHRSSSPAQAGSE